MHPYSFEIQFSEGLAEVLNLAKGSDVEFKIYGDGDVEITFRGKDLTKDEIRERLADATN